MAKYVIIAALLISAAIVQPALADTVLTFDNIPEGTIVAGQYTGVVITGASVLTENSQLNPAYPPVSDPNVIYDYADGTITMTFSPDVDSIGAYVTGEVPITLSAYDGATLLGSTATPGANYVGASTGYSPNIFLSLDFPDITSAVFTNGLGYGDTFTLDNVTVGGTIITNGVPEPATWAMMLVGFGVMGLATRRRQQVSVTYA